LLLMITSPSTEVRAARPSILVRAQGIDLLSASGGASDGTVSLSGGGGLL
jgi:hypothetical protein